MVRMQTKTKRKAEKKSNLPMIQKIFGIESIRKNAKPAENFYPSQ